MCVLQATTSLLPKQMRQGMAPAMEAFWKVWSAAPAAQSGLRHPCSLDISGLSIPTQKTQCRGLVYGFVSEIALATAVGLGSLRSRNEKEHFSKPGTWFRHTSRLLKLEPVR